MANIHYELLISGDLKALVKIITNFKYSKAMKKFLSLCAIASIAFMASCSQNGGDEPTPQPESEKLPINISTHLTATRATDSAFEPGDEVGIYVVNQVKGVSGSLAISGNYVDNMCFTYGDNKWTPDTEIYWADKTTKADFYCYYPYAKPTSVAAHTFATKTNQSTLANYKASEFIWGKAVGVTPSADVVPITMNHSLSNAIVVVAPGTGFTAETLATADIEVKISNVKPNASINLANGTVTASGTSSSITMYKESNLNYRALIVPQTVAESALVVITIDGITYTLTKGFTFKPNTRHTFTVTVNKLNSGINIGIGDWTIDETDHGGSAE